MRIGRDELPAWSHGWSRSTEPVTNRYLWRATAVRPTRRYDGYAEAGDAVTAPVE